MLSPKILQAGVWATKLHEGQTRSNGEPYVNHPFRVASILSLGYEIHGCVDDENVIIASLLHDVIEDTSATYEMVQKMFGTDVADLVQAVTSDKEELKRLGKTKYLIQKMINMSQRELVIKLADRLDNVSDLSTAKSKEWADKYCQQTLEIIKAVAEYLPSLMHKDGSFVDGHRLLLDLVQKIIRKIDV